MKKIPVYLSKDQIMAILHALEFVGQSDMMTEEEREVEKFMREMLEQARD